MANAVDVSKLWKWMSVELLDAALRVGPVRRWVLAQGERQLFRTYVEENREGLPPKVQDIRCRALVNLLRSVERALADGRISSNVRRSIFKEFLGKLVIEQGQGARRFRECFGHDPPLFLTISPTKLCNLHCKGCYAASSAGSSDTCVHRRIRPAFRE